MAEGAKELPFEELLLALKRLIREHPDTPARITDEELRIGARRVLWQVQERDDPTGPAYRRFGEKLRRCRGRVGVISFNWDVHVERVLCEAGIRWRYWAAEDGRVPVIKPHGSINWSAHRKLDMAPYGGQWVHIPNTSFSYIGADPLTDPGWDDVVPQIVHTLYPGDSDSPSADADVAAIWKDAGRLLERAGRVVFIGYSFPGYDEQVAGFFRKMVRRREVVVVNPSVQSLARASELLRVHASAFRTRQERFNGEW